MAFNSSSPGEGVISMLISVTGMLRISYKIALKWMLCDLIGDSQPW